MRRAGFTLLEIIVVIVMLGVLAGVLLPRTAGMGASRAREEAMGVRDLLTHAAERGELRSQGIAVQYDAKTLRLAMLVQREVEENGRTMIQWRPDVLAPAVQLDVLRLTSATMNGRPLDRGGFIVDLAGLGLAGARPEIAMVLTPTDETGSTASAWRVELPPDVPAGIAAPVTGTTADKPLVQSRSVDLDAEGRSVEPW